MPTTRIAKLGRERTITTLARKIYQIGSGPEAAEPLRRAEAALLAANPRLDRPEGYRSGATIVVPEVSGLDEIAAVSAAPPLGPGGLLAEARLQIQAAGSHFDDAFVLAARRREAALAQAGDNAFRNAARKALPESAQMIAEAREQMKDEQDRAGSRSDALKQNLERALEALDRLEANARRTLGDDLS